MTIDIDTDEAKMIEAAMVRLPIAMADPAYRVFIQALGKIRGAVRAAAHAPATKTTD